MLKRNRFKRTRTNASDGSSNEIKRPCLEKVEEIMSYNENQQTDENIAMKPQVIKCGTETKHDVGAVISEKDGYTNEDGNVEEYCPVCKNNISEKDAKAKEEHLNKCFNDEELAIKQQREEKEWIENEKKKILPCPICGKPLRTYNSRISHLKKCSSDNNVAPASLSGLLLKQVEERDSYLKAKLLERGSIRGKLLSALNTISLKKFRPVTKRNKIKYEEPINKFEEDIQLAIALSTSINESHNVRQDNTKVQPSNFDSFQINGKSIREKKKHKIPRRKLEERVNPLMAISLEDSRMLIQDKFLKMQANWPMITENSLSTIILMPSKLTAKYKPRRCLWNMTSFSEFQCKSFDSTIHLFLVPEIFELQSIDDRKAVKLIEERSIVPQECFDAPLTQTAYLLADLATDYSDTEESSCIKRNTCSGEGGHEYMQTNYLNPMECFRLMVNNSSLSDLKLILDGDYKFHVHKLVLFVRCPKFYEIIFDKEEYLMTPYNFQTIQSFFEFIYASIVHINEFTVLPLQQLAQRFEVAELLKLCCDFMKSPMQSRGKESNIENNEQSINIDVGKDVKVNINKKDDNKEGGDDEILDEVYEYMLTQRLKQKVVEKSHNSSFETAGSWDNSQNSEKSMNCLLNGFEELVNIGCNSTDCLNHQDTSVKVSTNFVKEHPQYSPGMGFDIDYNERMPVAKGKVSADNTLLKEFNIDMECGDCNTEIACLESAEISSGKFNLSCSPDMFTSRNGSTFANDSMKKGATCEASLLSNIQNKGQDAMSHNIFVSSKKSESASYINMPDQNYLLKISDSPSGPLEKRIENDDTTHCNNNVRSSELTSKIDGAATDGLQNNLVKYHNGWVNGIEDIMGEFQESFQIVSSSPRAKEVLLQKTPKSNTWRRCISQCETPKGIEELIDPVGLNMSFSPPTDISHLDSPEIKEARTKKNVSVTETPISKKMVFKNTGCLTPILQYEHMKTPLLKEHCQNYGVRPVTKGKMIKILKNIYYGTHPDIQRNPGEIGKKASKTKRIQRSKATEQALKQSQQFDDKMNLILDNPECLSGHEKNGLLIASDVKEIKKGFTFKSIIPKKNLISPKILFNDCSTLNSIKASVIQLPKLRNDSCVNNFCNSRVGSHLTRSTSFDKGDRDDSDGEVHNRRCIEEECMGSDEFDGGGSGGDNEEMSLTQRANRRTERPLDNQKKDKLHSFFLEKSNYLKILHYEPFQLDRLIADIKSKSIKISKQFLVEFMDEKNILFTTRTSNRNSHLRQKEDSNAKSSSLKVYDDLI